MEEVFGKITMGEFKMPTHFSENCIDILRKMICVNPKDRITARDALKHPWITAGEEYTR